MTLRITTALLVGLVASTSHAASGFYNMPTSLPQCMGFGWGPGYHAEMALKPYYRSWNASQGVVRMNPHEYPPIYPNRVAHASPAPAVHYAQPAPRMMAAPRMIYTPAPTPAAVQSSTMFAAPAVQQLRPAKPLPRPEVVRGEPASPSDAARPARLPDP